MCGKLDPTNNAFVQNFNDSAKRTAKPPVKKKDPVTSDMFNVSKFYRFIDN